MQHVVVPLCKKSGIFTWMRRCTCRSLKKTLRHTRRLTPLGTAERGTPGGGRQGGAQTVMDREDCIHASYEVCECATFSECEGREGGTLSVWSRSGFGRIGRHPLRFSERVELPLVVMTGAGSTLLGTPSAAFVQ
eukprot:4954096-Amphidinium_carterae.1